VLSSQSINKILQKFINLQ